MALIGCLGWCHWLLAAFLLAASPCPTGMRDFGSCSAKHLSIHVAGLPVEVLLPGDQTLPGVIGNRCCPHTTCINGHGQTAVLGSVSPLIFCP